MTDACEAQGPDHPAPGLRADLLAVSVAGLVAAVGGTLLMRVAGVVGGDAPAHTYKTELVRAGASIFWDNRWYGGVYGPIDYGPVYYWVASVASEVLVTVLSTALLPVFFLLYLRAAGRGRGRWAALSLAAVLAVYLTYGQGPFLLAMALTTAGMALLAAGRSCLAALLLGIGLFANPLALIVAGPFLVADIVARPGLRRRYALCAAMLAPFLILEAALTLLFWQPSRYLAEFSVLRLALMFCAVGLLLGRSSRADGARSWRWFFVVYATVCLLSFALPVAALGNNVARTFQLLGVPVLLAIEGVRLPRWVGAPAIVVVAFMQLAAPVGNYLHPDWYAASSETFWRPALVTLDGIADSRHRLHVVATRKHAEALFVPRAGYAITRGWFRQDDAVHNELFARDFGEAEYVAWLRRMGVEYVLLPHVALDFSSRKEPAILASSMAFVVVVDTRDWTIYRLVAPEALVEPLPAAGGAGAATVVALDTSRISLQLSAPGAYEVRVSWSPYWRVLEGEAELARSRDGFVIVSVAAAGPLVLELTVTPQAVADRVRDIF